MKRSLIAAAALGLLVTGCAAGPSIFTTAPEALPEALGGLPADAPEVPKKPYGYPAVHDMPPPRAAKTLDDRQQMKLEDDLRSAADRQLRQSAEDAQADEAADDAVPAPKKPAATAKKPAKPTAQAGAKTNP